MSAALRVLAPGLMTTVRDLGRIGYQRLGIPVGGALDTLSLRAANLLVGNPPDVGGLEIIASGPTLAVEADSVRLAFVGADADLSAAGEAPFSFDRRVGQSMLLRRGDILRVGWLRSSATLYMAVEGGFDIAPVMGSVSTNLRGGLGGFRGRALAAGDLLPLKRSSAREHAEQAVDTADFAPRRRLRALEGPQQSVHFGEEERAAFFGREYVVGPGWNRMGMRLAGEPVRHSQGYLVTSDGIVHGSIQVPGDGLPIVLLAERQTTGGYPKIGAVISADLPALGRLGAGSRVAFERVSLEEAEAAGRAHMAFVERLPSRLSPLTAAWSLDLPARLSETNLVSGVIDACASG